MSKDSLEDFQGTPEQFAKMVAGGALNKFHESFLKIQELMACYRCAILEVETKFRVLDEQFSLQHERNPIDSIETRLKSAESIFEKIKRKELPLKLSSIEKSLSDVAGVRVVCSFVDDIYMLADCLLSQDDIRLIRKKDYIKNPKNNGYRSLHLIIEVPIFLQNEKKYMKVEVQLRTVAMDLWASLEHKLYYKKTISEKTAKSTAKQLSECAAMCALLDEKMQSIKNEIDEDRLK
ncbi:MAG: GTP pyrophosphokinase family protein [Clostridia bacterium]|nr:GTP pyrophosphokinase family protein [Clostridia bacterium]